MGEQRPATDWNAQDLDSQSPVPVASRTRMIWRASRTSIRRLFVRCVDREYWSHLPRPPVCPGRLTRHAIRSWGGIGGTGSTGRGATWIVVAASQPSDWALRHGDRQLSSQAPPGSLEGACRGAGRAARRAADGDGLRTYYIPIRSISKYYSRCVYFLSDILAHIAFRRAGRRPRPRGKLYIMIRYKAVSYNYNI